MKLDQVDKTRSFSRRLLNDFSTGLFALLQEKRLEEITVGELCRKCNYPRSTFYNYFEDIYALMDYCWEAKSEQLHINEFQEIEHDERTLVLFERVYDYIDSHRSVTQKLLKHNAADGAMMVSLNQFIRKTVLCMVTECPLSYKFPVPYQIMAEHYSNTVQLLLSCCFLDKSVEKVDAIRYMDFLLGTLEKESTRK